MNFSPLLQKPERFAVALMISNHQYFRSLKSKTSSLGLYRSAKQALVDLLRSLLQSQSPFVFQFLVTLRVALYDASLAQATESEAMFEEVQKVDAVIAALLQLPSVHDNQFKILLPTINSAAPYVLPSHLVKKSKKISRKHPEYFSEWFNSHNSKLMQCMDALDRRSPLGLCLQNELKAPFGVAFVLEDVSFTFWRVIVHMCRGRTRSTGLFLFGILGIPRYDDFTDFLVKGNVQKSLARTDRVTAHSTFGTSVDGFGFGFGSASRDGGDDDGSMGNYLSTGGRQHSRGSSGYSDGDDDEDDEDGDDDDALANPAFEYMMRRCSLKTLLVSEICSHTSDVSIYSLAMSSLVRSSLVPGREHIV